MFGGGFGGGGFSGNLSSGLSSMGGGLRTGFGGLNHGLGAIGGFGNGLGGGHTYGFGGLSGGLGAMGEFGNGHRSNLNPTTSSLALGTIATNRARGSSHRYRPKYSTGQYGGGYSSIALRRKQQQQEKKRVEAERKRQQQAYDTALAKAKTAFEDKQYSVAKSYFVEALRLENSKLNVKNNVAGFGIVQCYFHQGNFLSAYKQINKIAECDSDQLSFKKTIISKLKSEADKHVQIGKQALQAQTYELANQSFMHAENAYRELNEHSCLLDLQPLITKTKWLMSDRKEALKAIDAAKNHQSLGEHSLALQAYQRALACYPERYLELLPEPDRQLKSIIKHAIANTKATLCLQLMAKGDDYFSQHDIYKGLTCYEHALRDAKAIAPEVKLTEANHAAIAKLPHATAFFQAAIKQINKNLDGTIEHLVQAAILAAADKDLKSLNKKQHTQAKINSILQTVLHDNRLKLYWLNSNSDALIEPLAASINRGLEKNCGCCFFKSSRYLLPNNFLHRDCSDNIRSVLHKQGLDPRLVPLHQQFTKLMPQYATATTLSAPTQEQDAYGLNLNPT